MFLIILSKKKETRKDMEDHLEEKKVAILIVQSKWPAAICVYFNC